MNLENILQFSHSLLKKIVFPGDVVIDATCGNGHDTLFLAQLVGVNGMVYGFDIQKEAIEATATRLEEAAAHHQVQLFQTSHENIHTVVDQPIKAAIYNLGYLPGGDKAITTNPSSTLTSIEQALLKLIKGGMAILVIYHGHPSGKLEKEAILTFVQDLAQQDFHVLEYRFLNQQNHPPFVIVIEKRSENYSPCS
ncbi:class I SAM-dependent methyltransferase [Listeria sp. PSOL-1]|uniref:class I SAM-dependent methyltransferase n=1 Tax=Listeria sp. PSOL-1 TaxID=1844999 RepID=UPI0013D72FDF|nr:class I SAM-dependent methyltransferase [Listeria sp. PSOL-1]